MFLSIEIKYMYYEIYIQLTLHSVKPTELDFVSISLIENLDITIQWQ